MTRPFATFALAAAALPVLAACATTDDGAAPRPAGDTCQAQPGQAFIGRTASAAVGAELLAATRSREIRWVPPGMMVTMDYKFGRLTVSYDEAMKIVSVSCS